MGIKVCPIAITSTTTTPTNTTCTDARGRTADSQCGGKAAYGTEIPHLNWSKL